MRFFRRRRVEATSQGTGIDRKAVLEAALTRALAEQAIHEGFRDTVRRLIFEDSDGWRRCCGSGCEPCVMQLERAVDDVRRAIGWKPGDEAPRPSPARGEDQ